MSQQVPSKKTYPFRVFVSYSHEDSDLAAEVVRILDARDIRPIWDRHIHPGSPFTDTIKGLISHAHLFMPLITQTSMARPWVHQETGYAMAIDIPVLPLAVGELPDQMIAQLEAIKVSPDLSDLCSRLSEVDFEKVVFPGPPRPRSIVQIADWPEQRAELLAQCAKRVIQHGEHGYFRQRGGLSSLCIPDVEPSHHIWDCREGDSSRSPYHRHLQREERRALEIHAREAGCSLILDPRADPKAAQTRVRARLSVLLDFIESMPDDRLSVAIWSRRQEGNLAIVGDWFVAETVTPRPGVGYQQTIFTWHAPTVLDWVRRFDHELRGLSPWSTADPKSSRLAAVEQISEIIRGLPPCQKRASLKADVPGPCCAIAERLAG